MAVVFKTPGVYIQEIPTFPPSVAEVETAIPAFIGYTKNTSFSGKNLLKQPTRITSLLEYETFFGGAQTENAAFTVSITDTGAGAALVRNVSVAYTAASLSKYRMYYAMQLYFANGGGPCYIVSVGDYSGGIVEKSKLKEGLDEIGKVDEPTLLLFPDGTNIPGADAAAQQNSYYELINDALKQCFNLQDRFVIYDVWPATDVTGNINAAMNAMRNSTTLGNGLDEMKYGASYYPFLNTTLNYVVGNTLTIAYTKDGVVLTADDVDANAEDLQLADLLAPRPNLEAVIKTGLSLPNATLYNQIKAEINKQTVVMPPSPAVAGIYAKVDASRGVWKAPANESLAYCSSAVEKISSLDQQNLNVDPGSGKSINAIRFFTGKGLLVWGARTLAGNDNEWRYINVRRFFNFAEESIKKGTEWVVFEPNDANTWVRVRAMIENFLIKQWRAGALAGAKPEQAFYVRVGLGVTMTALDILEGRLNVEIGMAVVRPAEFIILKFSHKLQES
jgi:phage tail sheath protein FI